MNKLRIRLYLSLFIILFITLGVNNALSGWMFHHEYREAIQNEMNLIGKNIKQLLEHNLSDDTPISQLLDFNEVIVAVTEDTPDVAYALVLDRKSDLIYHNRREAPQSIALDAAAYQEIIRDARSMMLTMEIDGQPYPVAVTPVLDAYDVVQGAVLIAVPHSYITNKTSVLLYYSAIQAVVFLLISLILLSLFLTRWVTRPLQTIMEVMRSVSSGNLDARAHIQGKDEFAVLGNKLNTMIGQFRELLKSKEKTGRLEVQYVQEQERRRLSELLRHSMYVISSTLDENQVQKLVLEQLKQFIDATRTSLWLYDDDRSLYCAETIVDVKLDQHELPYELNSEMVRLFGVRFKDNPSLEYVTDLISQVRLMIIPVYAHQDLTGIIVLERYDQPFTTDEAEYVLPFTNQAGIAMSNATMYRKMEQMAITDELTGLYNRRYFYRLVEQAVEQAHEDRQPLAVIIFDVDFFKLINDQYGHFIGDEVLRFIARSLADQLTPDRVIARFGGEEFICLLPNTDIDEALQTAERLRAKIAEQQYETTAGLIRVTLSIGVADMRQSDRLETFLQRADEALYQAKGTGRNQVIYKAE